MVFIASLCNQLISSAELGSSDVMMQMMEINFYDWHMIKELQMQRDGLLYAHGVKCKYFFNQKVQTIIYMIWLYHRILVKDAFM